MEGIRLEFTGKFTRPALQEILNNVLQIETKRC